MEKIQEYDIQPISKIAQANLLFEVSECAVADTEEKAKYMADKLNLMYATHQISDSFIKKVYNAWPDNTKNKYLFLTLLNTEEEAVKNTLIWSCKLHKEVASSESLYIYLCELLEHLKIGNKFEVDFLLDMIAKCSGHKYYDLLDTFREIINTQYKV